MRCAKCGRYNPKEAVFCEHCGKNLVLNWRVRGAIGGVVGVALTEITRLVLGIPITRKLDPTFVSTTVIAITFAIVFAIAGGIGGTFLGAFLNGRRNALRAAIGGAVGFTGGGAFLGVIGDAYWYDFAQEIKGLIWVAYTTETPFIAVSAIGCLFLGLFLSKGKNALMKTMTAIVGSVVGGLIGLAIVNWFGLEVMDKIAGIVGRVLGGAILFGVGGGIGGAFFGTFLYGHKGAFKGMTGGIIGFAIGGAIISAFFEVETLPLIGFVGHLLGFAIGGAFLGVFISKITVNGETCLKNCGQISSVFTFLDF